MNYLRKFRQNIIFILQKVNLILFVLNGKKPWTRGYYEYKVHHIKNVLSRDYFNLNKLPGGYGFRIDERIIEYPWLFSRLPENSGILLDAGSVLNFDYILSHNSLKSKKIFISTLAPEGQCYWDKGISYIYDDLRETCFRDNYFDWIASLSTIEHIGMDNTFLYTDDILKKENKPSLYLLAIQEYYRILKPGGILYLSFPYGKYKNHNWFQVFDSEMVDTLINRFSPGSIKEYYFKYEPDGWCISSREEAGESTCFDINRQKNYDDDYAAFSRAIACLEMIK